MSSVLVGCSDRTPTCSIANQFNQIQPHGAGQSKAVSSWGMVTDLRYIAIVDSVCIHRKRLLLRKSVHGEMNSVVKDFQGIRPIRLYTGYTIRVGAIEAAGLSIWKSASFCWKKDIVSSLRGGGGLGQQVLSIPLRENLLWEFSDGLSLTQYL